jgi:hypothetical protein
MVNAKKGQMQISFGMIFSIIIIIAIIAVAVYVIIYFLNLNKCTETGTFKQKLQERIDQAYSGGKTLGGFDVATLPSAVKYVCFGNYGNGYLGQATNDERTAYQGLVRYANPDINMYIYPPGSGCNKGLSTFELEHIQTVQDKFFCVKVNDGKASIKISKSVEDALVTISK